MNRFQVGPIIGVLLAAAGIVLGVLAFLFPEFVSVSYISALGLIITGIIIFAVFSYLTNLFKDFPMMKGKGKAMRDSASSMSSMSEFLKQQNKINKLKSNGIPIKVKILSVKDTGDLINNDPLLEFQLEVFKDNPSDNYFINSHKQIVSKVVA